MDPDSQRERERCALTIIGADPAIEWLRPLPPAAKLVGPVLPEPARPLPTDLEVSHSQPGFHTCMQAFKPGF